MVKVISILFVALLVACNVQHEQKSVAVSPSNLLVEGKKHPLNVHNPRPKLSWHSNVKSQSYYQIQASSSEDFISRSLLWDSGKIQAKHSLNIEYQGRALGTNDAVFWRVRVWQPNNNQAGQWSEPGVWEMGLLEKSDWQAQWIQVKKQVITPLTENVTKWVLYATGTHKEGLKKLPKKKAATQMLVVDQVNQQPTAGLFRHNFFIKPSKKIVKAKLHSTAAGYYEVYINGQRVSDRIMDPGQTDFDKRILYNTDDVSDFLLSGNNTIGVHLGSGWYDENIAFSRWKNPDGSTDKPSKTLSYGQPKFIAQLELSYDDGSKQIVASNEQWLSHPSPVIKEGVFSGELYNAQNVVKNWNKNKSNLNGWEPVQVLTQWPTETLEPQLLPPIRPVKKMTVQKIFQPKANVWVLDFGQNFTGVPTFNLDKLGLRKGQAVFFRYAEWADIDGNISQKTGGSAPLLKQVDGYIASGEDSSTWTPEFTWHGFRYLEITGLDKAPTIDAITAHLVRSDVEIAGTFKSSNELINRIHDMALWTYESNLMAVPMDCPIRERAGWTGDAHAALITGNYNYNMDNFWKKYLGDFKTAAFQAPAVVPGKRTHGGNFDWAVAEIIIAWEHYRHHGDIDVLQGQFNSLIEYMELAESKMDNGLLRIGYGDWCDPVLKPGMGRKRCNPQHTSPTITSSALLAHGSDLMSKIAELLNKPQKAQYYSALFKSIAAQFNKEFYNLKTNHYGSQTADAMALRFNIAPAHLHQSIADALNKDVLENWKGHGSVGALGQTYLYLALSDYGYGDTAFNIFTADGYPGYSFQFEKLNATTLWERKGVLDPDLDPERRNAPGRSLNHPFHSGYDGWFYEGLGGIRPLDNEPGYQTFELRPVFPKGLEWVDVSYQTGYGTIKSSWVQKSGVVKWNIEIPNNSSAYVTILNEPKKLYRAGTYSFEIKSL
ncbi:alpha-L-rhamnosidase [Pseudoalteromonas sp. APC 3355]|uniref:alpha-L-rhamnosidase n=1 Tax=Pseudoalteromonas sp. APC 3355 TaxID=3035199 RepID=UPI0025B52FD3|nr:alpha-L-rhamnosidase [Pseudoalteromonas sp. APC 3355]MDN3476835.1 family 78 glycoside hydrolase catalytic domain [Pseudoalteromonas sp. APC 3355]